MVFMVVAFKKRLYALVIHHTSEALEMYKGFENRHHSLLLCFESEEFSKGALK